MNSSLSDEKKYHLPARIPCYLLVQPEYHTRKIAENSRSKRAAKWDIALNGPVHFIFVLFFSLLFGGEWTLDHPNPCQTTQCSVVLHGGGLYIVPNPTICLPYRFYSKGYDVSYLYIVRGSRLCLEIQRLTQKQVPNWGIKMSEIHSVNNQLKFDTIDDNRCNYFIV